MLWLLLAACDVGRTAQYEARLASMSAALTDAQVALADAEFERDQLQEQVDICRADPTQVQADATALFEEMHAAQQAWDAPAARSAYEVLQRNYPHTNAGRVALRQGGALDAFGRSALPLDGVTWFGDTGTLGPVTVLYFMEEWCPHCRTELPTMQAQHLALVDQGVTVIGLTEVSRTSTPDSVQALLQELQVTFPVGQVPNRSLHDHYLVEGIPAAAVLVDGQVAWRGGARQIDWARVAQAAE